MDRYALAWNYTEPYFAIPFISGYGGWIMDDANQPTLNTPAVVRAGKFIYDLARTHRIIPRECDYEIANALFKDGLSAMIINGPWSWATYIDNGIDIGIARIPRIDETGLWPAPMISPLGYSLNVNLKGEPLRIAVELLQFLTSPEVELSFTRMTASIPSRREAVRSPLMQNNELFRQSLYQLEVGRLMPVVTEMRWIWDAMRPGYQAIFTGEMTPEQAAASMQTLALKLIEENRK
jgi:maltose-binding protein MalE